MDEQTLRIIQSVRRFMDEVVAEARHDRADEPSVSEASRADGG